MKKLSEIELLKYWLDAEISFIHAMIAFIAILLTTETWQHVLLWVYIAYCLLYSLVRMGIVFTRDKDYLILP